ncbi:MAG: energy-coupling factor transporter transmembrane protein EcfT [Armatimonadetes bacterium]|nr:energy-coupling factor transporter transmembrane protein EcfT [Armatimonadota bacterium]
MDLVKYAPVGQYLPRNSPLHRLDPRTKILATMALAVVLFLLRAMAGLGLFAVASLALLVLGQIPLGYALRGLRPVIFLLLLTVVLNAFFGSGGSEARTLFVLGPLVATEEGLRTGLFVGARLLLLVTITSLLTFTTSSVELADGLEWLLRPLRRVGLPGHEIAMMMTIALRFIPTLLEETERIMKAQTARGAEFGQGNIVRRAQALVPVLVPLLLSAIRRSEELALAMEARCYSSSAPRTRMKELRWGLGDAVAGVLVVAASALLVSVR